MLRNGSTQFLWMYEMNMYGGNDQWADPEEAIEVGEAVGEELFARFDSDVSSRDDSPEVEKSAHKVLKAALSTIDYAALPTERRANILRGIINTLEKSGALGGEPEWANTTATTTAVSDI